MEWYYLAVLGGAGAIVGFVSFFIINWILLLILMPGITYVEVDDADTAATRVSSTQVGLLALVSLALYKICGKKETAKKVEAPVSATTEIDYLINSIE